MMQEERSVCYIQHALRLSILMGKIWLLSGRNNKPEEIAAARP